jgi:hypothetical protein
MGKCDKCGLDVPPNNDASIFGVYTGELDPAVLMTISSRHLLPTTDCEGSPSRAQYLPGQKKDSRGYKYNPKVMLKYRNAFITMIIDIHNKIL